MTLKIDEDEMMQGVFRARVCEALDFEVDEEIEISYRADFSCPIKVKFKHKEPVGLYFGADKYGCMFSAHYARKIKKKVAVCINFKVYEISVELADKIIAGECNV